jgi:NAD(P)-dependent dehydrogenase (short-subunit alcohol dehydrogenase family)
VARIVFGFLSEAEMQGPYYFTQLLLPQLMAAGSSRVINVSSHGHILVDGIKWETLKDGTARQKMKPLDLYNQSKFVSNHWLQLFLLFLD